MTRFTKLVRSKYLKRGDTAETLAKALKVSPSFARHVIYADMVPLSPRVIAGIAKHYRIPIRMLQSLAEHRNQIGRRYYRQIRISYTRRLKKVA